MARSRKYSRKGTRKSRRSTRKSRRSTRKSRRSPRKSRRSPRKSRRSARKSRRSARKSRRSARKSRRSARKSRRSRRPKSGIKGGIPVLNCRIKRSPTDSKKDLIKEIRAYVNCWEKATGTNQDLSLERLRGETVSQLKNHLKWYRNN